MDSDLWISRLAAAKRQFSLQQRHQSSQSDRISFDDYEAEEELRQEFPCPYCYEEHDIASLCCHLEDEHPFESRATVCPICAMRISRDMLNHITLQHGQLFKLQRRRRIRKVAIPNSQALALLGRDLREAHLQVLLGSSGYRSSNSHTPAVAPDSLLSSLVLNLPTPEVEDVSKSALSTVEDTTKATATSQKWKPSIDASLSHEERERRLKQAKVRATFMQDLLLSTLFGD